MHISAFIDPRLDCPAPKVIRAAATTSEPDDVRELHMLCREGRLYDVERWVQAGRPLQVICQKNAGGRRPTSALEIALENENHALVLLLLCNGYDPNLEHESPLNLALRARRWDLVDMLLHWGANPHAVDPGDLFDTYKSALIERFYALGVDVTDGHALADSLAHHTSNKPLFGFAKRHCNADPKIQAELNIALVHHAEEGNEKGVQLCLWAGADPHTPAASLRYPSSVDNDDEDDEEDRFLGFTAIEEACRGGHLQILDRLRPDPAKDDFDALYRSAYSGDVIALLARYALPTSVGVIIQSHLWRATWSFGEINVFSDSRAWRSVHALERLFEVGARWENSSAEEITAV